MSQDTLNYLAAPSDSFSPWHLHSYVDTLSVAYDTTGSVPAPVPYHAGADNVVSGVLLAAIILALLSLAGSARFIARMSKNFFYAENEYTSTVPDTTGELTHQALLALLTCLLASMMAYCYTIYGGHGELPATSKHLILLVFFAAAVGYLLLTGGLYLLVNWVFFDRKKIEQWNKSQLFLTAMEGVAFSPLVLLLVFGGLPLRPALIALAVVVLLVKILTFYKGYVIFFRRFGAFLQNFLYFCALEMIPLSVLVGFLEVFNAHLIINF